MMWTHARQPCTLSLEGAGSSFAERLCHLSFMARWWHSSCGWMEHVRCMPPNYQFPVSQFSFFVPLFQFSPCFPTVNFDAIFTRQLETIGTAKFNTLSPSCAGARAAPS